MAKWKRYEKDAAAIERRFNRNLGNDAAETYKAVQDYRENIEKQETELQNMDPNSREYRNASQSLDEQRNALADMEYKNNNAYNTADLERAQKRLERDNDEYAREMQRAAERGDTKRYDEYRGYYESNITAQEKMNTRVMEYNNGEENHYMETQHQRQFMYDMDNRMAENARDGETAEKYRAQVEQDRYDMIKSQNDHSEQRMESTYGLPQEEIDRQKEKNQERLNELHRY